MKYNYCNYRSRLFTVLILVIILVSSCSTPPRINDEGPYWKDDDNKGIPEPPFEEPSLIWTNLKRTTNDQLLELLDLDRNIRKISGNPTQAKNTNCFDEVPNSSWFNNRHGHPDTRLTRKELVAGPNLTTGPDTSKVWEVFRPKVGGATPGFWIEDSRGDQYIIKFDPKNNPEMATAAATMSSRYFYACGYNVPQESIVYWRPEILKIRDGATIKDRNGKKRSLTMDDINAILEKANQSPDGTIRSLASLNIGNVKGPFMYEGTRKDDPNDWCPHEHRRELRGLYVIGSLVNHYDLKDHNSMDVYVGENDSGYLKHYLMDFGSTFGSDGQYVKIPKKGYANMFDLRDVSVTTITLGLKTWAWEYANAPKYSSIGYFESELFEPNKFNPIIPNPAFEQLTYQDAYWGAKIVMSFSDEDLAALVKTGNYSNPEAEKYLLRILKERQNKIGHFWFDKVNPLDYPSINFTDGILRFTFQDLAVEYGLVSDVLSYHYEIRYKGKKLIPLTRIDKSEITFSELELQSIINAVKSSPNFDKNQNIIELRIQTERCGKKLTKPAIFWILFQSDLKLFSIVGIEHPA